MKTKKGFTLFELLVSISIIAILTAIAVVSYSGAQKKARNARRIQDIDAIAKAEEQYYSDNTRYVYTIAELVNAGSLQETPADPKPTNPAYALAQIGTTGNYCLCATLEDAAVPVLGNYGSSACGAGKGFYCRKGQQE